MKADKGEKTDEKILVIPHQLRKWGVILVCLLLGGPVMSDAASKPSAGAKKTERATYAAGCFWCIQHPYEKMKGVISTAVGYTGGRKVNPTYEEVSAGETGHLESIEVVYDPSQVTYEELLELFWRNIDPTDSQGQFCDKGEQYLSAIFYHDERQKALAEDFKRRLEKSGKLGKPVVTQILPASQFYPAEEYHQKYYEKNPIRYKFYRYNCGRDQRLQELWGKDGKR